MYVIPAGKGRLRMAVDGFMTKTQRYRKVTKPLLERKRRARMNLYLDELKELIVDSMEAEGEHIAKLEKADILELTVNYLKSHRPSSHRNTAAPNPPANTLNAEKFRAGYTQAAYEVSKVFSTLPTVDFQFGTQLLKHLGCQLKDLSHNTQSPSATTSATAGSSENQDLRPAGAIEIAARMAYAARRQPDEPVFAKADDMWRPW